MGKFEEAPELCDAQRPREAGAAKGCQVPSKVAGKYVRCCGNSPGQPMEGREMDKNGWSQLEAEVSHLSCRQTIASVNALPILGAWDWWRLGYRHEMSRTISALPWDFASSVSLYPPMKTHKARDAELWNGIVISTFNTADLKWDLLRGLRWLGSGAATYAWHQLDFRRRNTETCITTSSKPLSCSAVIHSAKLGSCHNSVVVAGSA